MEEYYNPAPQGDDSQQTQYQPQYQPDQPAFESATYDAPRGSLMSKLKNPMVLIAGGAILLVLLIVIIACSGGAKKNAHKYVKAMVKGDVIKACKYMAYDPKELILESADMDKDEFFEEMSDWMDEDIDSWRDVNKLMKEEMEDELEDEYGDYKITTKVVDVEKISVRKLKKEIGESRLETLEDEIDFDPDRIRAAKVVEVKVKIKGEDDTETERIEVYMVRIGLSWKVISPDMITNMLY